MATPTVSDTQQKNSHHVTLEELDGSNKTGFMIVNSRGEFDERLITRSNYPRTVTQFQQGASEYKDLNLPYKTEVQDTWEGGRGQLDYKDDRTRYLDSTRVTTSTPDQIILAGREKYTGVQDIDQAMPGDVTFVTLRSANTYLARQFTASATYTAEDVMLWLRVVGSPGDLTIAIYDNNLSDEPNTLLSSNTLKVTDFDPNTERSDISHLTLVGRMAQALVASTKYHIVVGGATGDASNYWDIAVDAAGSGVFNKSSDGVVWSSTTDGLYFLINELPSGIGITTGSIRGKMFEYKSGLYFVTTPEDGSNSKLYINGDRGTADDNSGDLTKLNDATQSWTAGEWAGAIVQITSGPGFREDQNWRAITGNTSTALTVNPAWNDAHTTSTEYVIIKSDTWNLLQSLSFPVGDVEVAAEVVYFTRQDNQTIERYDAFTSVKNPGVWTEELQSQDSDFAAEKMLALRDPANDEVNLWGVLSLGDPFGSLYWKGIIPPSHGDNRGQLYAFAGELFDNQSPWDEAKIANVTQARTVFGSQIQIGAGHTTGVAASKALPTPIDLTEATKLVFGFRSSVAANSGDLQLVLRDRAYNDQVRVADYLLHADLSPARSPSNVYHFIGDKPQLATSAKHYDGTTFTNKPKARDGDASTEANFATLTTSEFLYIRNTTPFDRIKITMGTTKNDVAATLTLQYFDGEFWNTRTIDTDGTDVAGDTLKQSGTIEYKMPPEWSLYTADSEEGYWVRLQPSANLTANMKIAEIAVYDQENGQYVDLPYTYDGDNASENYFDWTSTDYVLIGHPTNRFNKIQVSILAGTENDQASVLSLEYRSGSLWFAVENLIDGTDVSGDTMKASGTNSITFDPGESENWDLSTINGVTAYWVRLSVSVTLDAPLAFQRFDLLDSREVDYINLAQGNDGDTATRHYTFPNFQSDSWWYVGNTKIFEAVGVNLGSQVNGVAATLTAQYFDGELWQSLSITDGTLDTATSTKTLAEDGDITFTPPGDWEQAVVNGLTAYFVRFQPSANLDGVDLLEVSCDYTTAVATLNIPALTANVFEWVQLDISPDATQYPSWKSIVSMQINVVTDNGAQNLEFSGPINAAYPGPQYHRLPNGSRVVNMVAYGNLTVNPWVFFEEEIYEIQTQFNDQAVKAQIAGLEALRSSRTGYAAVHNDVYLYFSLGDQMIERYFEGSLEDIGFNKDEGMPETRQGRVSDMISYPGRIYASTSVPAGGAVAGEDTSPKEAVIMERRGSGWHEIYKAPFNQPIYDMWVQRIPDGVDRLWFNQGNYLCRLPIAGGDTFNPVNDPNFTYTHEGYLVTGWLFADIRAIDKLFTTLTLFTNNLVTGLKSIKVEYQIDDADLYDTWTDVTAAFGTSPSEEVDIATNFVQAKQIRFRIRLETNDETITPIVKAVLLDELLRFVPKRTFTFQFLLTDEPQNWWGNTDTTVRAETLVAQVETWNGSPTPLLMNTLYSAFTGVQVVVETFGMRPLMVDPDTQKEILIGEITLLEK